jgi:hypothetical protein
LIEAHNKDIHKKIPNRARDAQRKRTKDKLPVHSFQTLLKDPATIVKDRVQPRLAGASAFDKVAIPTPVQRQALQLLNVEV